MAGLGSIGHTFSETSERDLQQGEAIGLPFALLILLIVFGAAVAAGIPIIIALISFARAPQLVARSSSPGAPW